MKTAEELRASWDKNEALRDAWRKIVESPEWFAATTLIAAEATSLARRHSRMEGDPVLARQLKKLDGSLEAIELLQSLWKEAPKPEPPLEPYSDEWMAKVQKEKDQSRQQ